MKSKLLVVGERYLWRVSEYDLPVECELLSLEPIIVRYPRTAWHGTRLGGWEKQELRARDILCLLSEREAWEAREKKRVEARAIRDSEKQSRWREERERKRTLQARVSERLKAAGLNARVQETDFLLSADTLSHLLDGHPDFPVEEESALSALLDGQA